MKSPLPSLWCMMWTFTESLIHYSVCTDSLTVPDIIVWNIGYFYKLVYSLLNQFFVCRYYWYMYLMLYQMFSIDLFTEVPFHFCACLFSINALWNGLYCLQLLFDKSDFLFTKILISPSCIIRVFFWSVWLLNMYASGWLNYMPF